MAPSICGGMNLVSPLKAMGLRINLRLNALASSLLRSPPFFFAGAVRARSPDGHHSIGLACPFPRMRIM